MTIEIEGDQPTRFLDAQGREHRGRMLAIRNDSKEAILRSTSALLHGQRVLVRAYDGDPRPRFVRAWTEPLPMTSGARGWKHVGEARWGSRSPWQNFVANLRSMFG